MRPRFGATALVLAITAGLAPSVARAEGWGGAPAEPVAADPLVPTAIAEAGTGVVIGAAGAVILRNAQGDGERCGRIAGCIDAVADAGAELDGRYVLGAGIGLASAGALTWAITEAAPLDPGDHRDSSAGTVAGSILVGIGASGVGAIIAGSTSPHHDTGANVGIGLGVAAMWAVGIPLLATSADGESRVEEAEERAQKVDYARRLATGPTEMASPGMVGAGTALTVVGGLVLGLGTAAVASGEAYTQAGGGVLMVGSVLFLGPGIPLLVVGSRSVPVDEVDTAVAPEVRVGLGSIQMSGRF